MNTIAKHILLTASALLMAMASQGCGSKNKEKGPQGPMAVDVAYPTTDSVTLYNTYPGQVYVPNAVQVVCRVNGVLLRQCYDSGAKVNKGQLMFVFESSKYRDAVTQAQAALATAKANYDYSSKQYDALKEALSSDAVSQMDVLQAKSNMESAKAAIRNAEAALSTARTNLSYCEVHAPVSGLAPMPVPCVGDYVGGEGSPVVLTTVYDDTQLGVRFNIEESQYEKLLGSMGGIRNPLFRKVPISFSRPLPHDYTIDLYYDSPTVDASTGTLQLKGKTPNEHNELKDGMYCTVHLPYGTDPKAILVRDASIGTDQLGKYVYVVNDSDKVVYTHIEVGDIYQDSLRIVTKGLKPTDRYVTKAMLKVRDGEKVKPVMKK